MPVALHHRYTYADPTTATTDGVPIDLAAANTQSLARLTATARVLVVPGFTPLHTKEFIRLHPTAIARLERALGLYGAGKADAFLLTGGNVHPEHTPYNEAWEMRRFLVEERGVPLDRVVIEPYARHTTTNLRNAGRILLSRGIHSAVIVTDPGQGFYVGNDEVSTFALRCLVQLGYTVGALDPLTEDWTQVRFTPSAHVWRQKHGSIDP